MVQLPMLLRNLGLKVLLSNKILSWINLITNKNLIRLSNTHASRKILKFSIKESNLWLDKKVLIFQEVKKQD